MPATLTIPDAAGSATSTLATLAKEINAAHRACESAARSMLNHARECGNALIRAKAELPHGKFTAWIDANCDFSQQHARRYMTIARGWGDLMEHSFPDGKTNTRERFLDTVSIREALRILSTGGNEQLFDENNHGYHIGAVTKHRCPACKQHMAVTSRHWMTCPHCFDCRLHGLPRTDKEPKPANYSERAKYAFNKLEPYSQAALAAWMVKWLDERGIQDVQRAVEQVVKYRRRREEKRKAKTK